MTGGAQSEMEQKTTAGNLASFSFLQSEIAPRGRIFSSLGLSFCLPEFRMNSFYVAVCAVKTDD
jgi:hypothetical protein